MKARVPVLFDQRHPLAALGEQGRDRRSGRTAAHDEDIAARFDRLGRIGQRRDSGLGGDVDRSSVFRASGQLNFSL
jgi:hypothetical protein